MLFENQSPAPKPIEDVEIYRDQLICDGIGGERSCLDTSEFFRHKKDYGFFVEMMKQAIESGEPLKFLEIGIGNMEEPISFLAAARTKLDGKKLEDVIDMEIVEIRDKNDDNSNFTNVNTNYRLGKSEVSPGVLMEPMSEYKDSFVLIDGEYEVVDEIKKYLSERIDDPTKTHFNTPIENFASSTSAKYDVIACNNVLQHLGGHEGYRNPLKGENGDYSRYYKELLKILNLVKEGGIIFIHASSKKFGKKSGGKVLAQIPNFSDDFEELTPEIYRRKIKNTQPVETDNKI